MGVLVLVLLLLLLLVTGVKQSQLLVWLDFFYKMFLILNKDFKPKSCKLFCKKTDINKYCVYCVCNCWVIFSIALPVNNREASRTQLFTIYWIKLAIFHNIFHNTYHNIFHDHIIFHNYIYPSTYQINQHHMFHYLFCFIFPDILNNNFDNSVHWRGY